MYSQLKLRPLGGGLFCVAWWSMRDRVARQSGRHPKSRQGLGKDTRIRRCDYPKLTRFVKRIPTCSGHVCCIDLGEESEPHRFQASSDNHQSHGDEPREAARPIANGRCGK
jgi:hypothetical protein